MQLSNQGLYYKGLRTEYEIIPSMNIISSKKNFTAGESNSHFKEVELIYNKKTHLCYKAASLNINNPKEVIDFCNKYGLFISSANNFIPTEDYYYDANKEKHYVKRTSIYDEMDLDTFKYCVAVLRSLMYAVENFAQRSNRSHPDVLLGCILTLLLNREYSYYSVSKDSETFTIQNSLLKEITFNQNFHEYDDEYKKYCIYMAACNDYDSSEFGLSNELEQFLDLLGDVEVCVDAYGVINVDKSFKFGAELKDALYAIAPKIVVWKMQKHTTHVAPRITIENETFRINWAFTDLFSYLILEFAFTVSSDFILAVCQNTKCGSLYNYAELRDNSKYCCKKCRDAQNKRNQRKHMMEESEKTDIEENNTDGADALEE